MGKQTVRYFDPVEETLEKIYKDNVLDKKDVLPLEVAGGFFLMPNGDYLRTHTNHTKTLYHYCKREIARDGSLEPLTAQTIESFYTSTGIIHIHYRPRQKNRLDLVIFAPITQTQLRRIYETIKDDLTLWLTYQIGHDFSPLVSGEGYREMLADLRKKNYLPKE